ncbi:hypothetical protein CDD83_5371 [Cordyceps sp. RAO-2017]|nr:hypothetical protein CDD83_5371 [Cordyceps sp. RAO-2017]
MLLASCHYAAAAPKILEYVNGMHEGRGVNTFTGELKRLNAVGLNRGVQSSADVRLQCNSRQISSYEELAKSLDVSVAASFKYGTFSASAKAKFLDQTKIEDTTITYIVTCSTEKQPDLKPLATFNWDKNVKNAAVVYGDRYIAGFVEGGSLVARVSIVIKNKSAKTEIEASASTAFNIFGVGAEVSASVKNSIDKIVKNSEVSTDVVYIGVPSFDTSTLKDEAKAGTEGQDEIRQLKKLTEVFMSKAASHGWKSYAVLEEYTNVPNFYPDQYFQPLDYSRAERKAWGAFNSYSRFRRILDALRGIDGAEFDGGLDKKVELQSELNRIIDAYQEWVDKVAANPAEADINISETPTSFEAKITVGEHRLPRSFGLVLTPEARLR